MTVKWRGVTIWTGGDLDGDLVHVSFNGKLLAIVRATHAAVQRMRPYLQLLEADVLAGAAKPCTVWEMAVEDRGQFSLPCGGGGFQRR